MVTLVTSATGRSALITIKEGTFIPCYPHSFLIGGRYSLKIAATGEIFSAIVEVNGFRVIKRLNLPVNPPVLRKKEPHWAKFNDWRKKNKQ